MNNNRFGTFEGVFTPTFLSILGVIMYLRLGWVVGQVGLSGALLIILISNLITLFTGFSIASIATNMRVGTGGAYSMISKSLGLEVGGAVGVPLYFAQAISVAFYITGFTECWVAIFPKHDFLIVSVVVWFAFLTISYVSAKLAFRIQYGIMVFIILSLVSIFMGKDTSGQINVLWQGLGELPFWQVFAVFFPAVTGVLAGVSMSGELKKPEHAIPYGTLFAIGISCLIYLLLAFWFSISAPAQDLVNNTAIILDLGRWRSLVIAGIMGATLSSALSMFVAAPRTLLALGKHQIIPFSSSFSRIDKKGEPSTAILFTAVIAIITIAMGTLNTIANLLTMVFLITYGMLNISVFIEKGIGIASFRPSFKVPLIFPFLGGLGCIFVMFVINPIFSIFAVVVVCALYFLFLKSQLRRNWPDVRRGLFIFIAEQAVKIASNLPYHPKIWKPNLLIPVEKPKDWVGIVDFLKTITFPSGRIDFFMIEQEGNISQNNLSLLSAPLKEEGILVSALPIKADNFLEGASIVVQTLKETPFSPNVFFLKLGLTTQKDQTIKKLTKIVAEHELGIMIFSLHPKVGFGQKKLINLWIRDDSPNIDLAVLTALQIEKNWSAKIRLFQIADNEDEKEKAEKYLVKVKKLMRIPKDAEINVLLGKFNEIVSNAPLADINIFGMSEEINISWIRDISNRTNSSTLFLRDSKHEDAIV